MMLKVEKFQFIRRHRKEIKFNWNMRTRGNKLRKIENSMFFLWLNSREMLSNAIPESSKNQPLSRNWRKAFQLATLWWKQSLKKLILNKCLITNFQVTLLTNYSNLNILLISLFIWTLLSVHKQMDIDRAKFLKLYSKATPNKWKKIVNTFNNLYKIFCSMK